MTISYNKLWKLLIDRGMKKNEFAEAEEHISKKKEVELFESGSIDSLEVGTFKTEELR